VNGSRRVIVVSNRLPISVEQVNGEVRVQPSCGGLVSALRPILQEPGATWVGWTGGSYAPGIAERIRASVKSNCALVPVFLTPAEKACFYDGCSNEVIWPLFHDLQSLCNFDPAYWDAYCQVTEKFADAVEQTAHRDDFVWVHDYHLIMLAEALHARELPLRLAYFHHIPFPSPDIFEKLPWRHDLLRCLLHFDSIGLQTSRDRVNFIASARRCLRDVEVKRVGDRLLVKAEGLATLVGTFPISIDFREFEQLAFDPAVAANAAAIQDNIRGEQIILGVDRLDYTKGIPQRLLAFRDLLEDHPELRGRVTLVQVVVPSREDIRSYQELKLRIERLVSEINGQYATSAWTPLVYMHRCLSRQQLVAFYRAANVALVTPLKDGMNLVAKEFCAAHVDEAGVLVLSEFAGAAAELQCGALLVNPYDSRGVALALYRALRMNLREQRVRMQRMRTWIQGHDVFHWAESVCGPITGYRVDHARDVTHNRLQPASALKEFRPLPA
jgi:trehalose 6-phosphate synthase/phosphatase